jgi:SAM-dependent methyltransferase
MVFIEHRGSGKAGADIGSMEARWDAEWCGANGPSPSADQSAGDRWPLIRAAMAPGGRVLEGGCGLGQWVRFLGDQGYEAYGVDYSLVAIQEGLRRWPDMKLVRADMRRMPFEDGFFDGIVSFGAIEHDIDGPDAVLREMRRVLRPGGVLFCTVPCYNLSRRMGTLAVRDWLVCNKTIRRLTGRKPDVSFFEYVWTPGEYADIMTRNGFLDVRLEPLTPRPEWLGRPGSFRRRFLESVHRRWPWLTPHMMAAICRCPEDRR